MSFTALSKKGKAHSDNEDAYLTDTKRNLFAVADGVTLYPGGKLASNLAIKYLKDSFDGNLKKSFLKVSNLILGAKKNNPNIGITTLTAIHIKDHFLEIGYTIDSPAFLIADSKIRLMTTGKKRGIIGEPKIIVYISTYELNKNDYVLLTTDGISDNLNMGELFELVKTNRETKKIAENIMKLVQERNPNDDKTIVVLKKQFT